MTEKPLGSFRLSVWTYTAPIPGLNVPPIPITEVTDGRLAIHHTESPGAVGRLCGYAYIRALEQYPDCDEVRISIKRQKP
jgi:hypothetical protein